MVNSEWSMVNRQWLVVILLATPVPLIPTPPLSYSLNFCCR
ncbi:hypothetical protein [Oscillatoria sp. FACHB-1407]|nr:hypothetical protein [Oscillatoria sp. FACHB-1407]